MKHSWTDWQSTPRSETTVILRCMREPYSGTGCAWRAYSQDGFALGISGETESAARKAVQEFFVDCRVTFRLGDP